ncbi:HMG box-containing protein 1-like isoform X1 [Mytilus trossulus]|uniref:HMG box-containing protein 1-like isoform X1 n=1 Tax=Mytilus trossulus TaxID=6551 RepID=UPI00300775E0
MASEPLQGKRPHVKTEKMMEFIKTQEEQHKHFSCPFEGCTKVLTSYPGLKYHIQRNHEPQSGGFICGKCERSFKSSNGLRYHCERGRCEEGTRRTDSASDEELPSENLQGYGAAAVKQEKLSKKKIPPALDLSNLNDPAYGTERLTEFAIIATSPLVQRAPMKPWEIPSGQLELYLRVKQECDTGNVVEMETSPCLQETRLSSTDKNGNYCDNEVTSSSESKANRNDVWSHQWPKPVWQCFIAGTKVCIGFVQWVDVEYVALQESIAQKAAGLNGYVEKYVAPNGLRLIEIRKFAQLDNISNSLVHLYFTSDVPLQQNMCAECTIDHPFFVKGKGWCSNDPVLTAQHYGIPCNRLETNDVCLQPSHSEPTETRTNYDQFTPMDRSAVYTLSTMAQKTSSPKKSPHSSPTKKRQLKLDQPKPKRPMNAFMLFAKDHREEYTQKYPGKDNRAISVLLGDEWQKMGLNHRHVYSEKAKLMADQQKKIHPDCWKRKK